MPSPLGALRQILRQRHALAQREQSLLSRLLSEIAQLKTNSHRGRKPGPKSTLRKRLTCRHCDRRFALPMHLGRHLAMSHRGRRTAA